MDIKYLEEMIPNLRDAGRYVKVDDNTYETYLLNCDDCDKIANNLEQLIKEYKQLIKDMYEIGKKPNMLSTCDYCKNNNGRCYKDDVCYFEWRGVKESIEK